MPLPGTATLSASNPWVSVDPGDPATTTTPPGRTKRSPIAATSPTPPTARATTASKAAASCGSPGMTSSARPSRTRTSGRLSSRQAARRKETRLRLDSTSVSAIRSSASLSGRPGIPPPAPMSSRLIGRTGNTRRNSSESKNSPRTISAGDSSAVIRCTRFHFTNRSRYRWNRSRWTGVDGEPVSVDIASRSSARTSRDRRTIGGKSTPRPTSRIRPSSSRAQEPSRASCPSAPCTSAGRSEARWRVSSTAPGRPVGSGT